MPLVSTVDYCEPSECPFENAFWNGEQMVYGAGLVTDDITGHELTHGVDAAESNLFYYYQSGALDEAIADIFGELFDLSLPTPGHVDAPADRWKIGEDSSLGTIRDMSDPPAFGQPDRTGSEEWFFDPETDFEKGDNGGVHENSGVGGKGAFLMTDGGTFNGQTVTGLGIEKTLQISYDVAANMLTSAADYQDYGNDLEQACSDLVGEHEITSADCEQVQKTVLATEMETPPAQATPATASLCAPGRPAVPVFSDDLENPASGNWAAHAIQGPNAFFYPQVPNPTRIRRDLRPQRHQEHLGIRRRRDLRLDDRDDEGGHRPERGPDAFRPCPRLRDRRRQRYDGGVIEYSVDDGTTWTDAGSLIDAGDAYGGTIFDGRRKSARAAGRPSSATAPATARPASTYPRSPANRSGSGSGSAATKRRKTTAGSSTTSRSTAAKAEENPPPPPPPRTTSATASAALAGDPGPTSNTCAVAHAALIRAQARVAKLRQRLRAMRPPTDAARSGVRRATAERPPQTRRRPPRLRPTSTSSARTALRGLAARKRGGAPSRAAASCFSPTASARVATLSSRKTRLAGGAPPPPPAR